MKKKLICALLSTVMALSLACPVLAAPELRVQLTNQNVMRDGETVYPEVYNINDSNYFKLRDIAYLLNGTPAQFLVGYDEALNAVSITTGQPYAPNGSEMTVGEDKSATAEPSAQTIFINGELRSDLTVYNLGGNNFFKLRDLGNALGFGVAYDEETRTMLITSSTCADAPMPSLYVPDNDVSMQYISVDDARQMFYDKTAYFLDVRPASAYSQSHLPGVENADMSLAVYKNYQPAADNLWPLVRCHQNDTVILVCYHGRTYAQAAFNVLAGLGYDLSKVYVVQGGFTSWNALYPGDFA